ncbi:hypothetical protein AAHA92_21799 [Salvia divinorum]|uniref:Myb/SANT-like domain-containing protein n=1 Tax=Salvia divinorum TaxID=28513 RepID=A0ABD1GLP0_SALDI
MTYPRRVVYPTDKSYGLPESSEGIGPGAKSRGDRTRRSWTVREEKILMATLKDLVAHGWKSKNGFRPGYLTRIEEAFKKEFPNSDIKGTPYINSKITQWKKSYYSMMGILDRSGVGFNMNRDFKNDCDNDRWEHIVKVRLDANARLMRNKLWPLWEDWKEVFGNDWVTGGVSEVMHEAFNEFSPNTDVQEGPGANEYNVNLEDLPANTPIPEQVPPEAPEDGAPEDGAGQNIHGSQQDKNRGKKCKSPEGSDAFIAIHGKLHEDTNSGLDRVTERIGYEFDVRKSRKEVYNILGTIRITLQE